MSMKALRTYLKKDKKKIPLGKAQKQKRPNKKQ